MYPARHLGQPQLTGQLQLLGIEQAKHPGKGVVRGDARGQGDEADEPVVVQFAELGHFHPVVCACDGGAQCHGEDGLEFMAARARKAWIGDELQVLQQGHGTWIG